MSLHQLNARKMYKKNDTKTYRQFLLSKDHRMIRLKARMVDSSGLTKKRQLVQATADALVVETKRENNVKKAAKKIKINEALDGITESPWLDEGLICCSPETGKPRTNAELDSQLAWHRRAELPRLKKPSESLIPKISKLTTKVLKIEALIGAVQHHIGASAGGVGLVPEQQESQPDMMHDVHDDNGDIVMEDAY
ncbi:hypothetical protein C8J57DRAFT_1243490 [Mycena rebaudengoi]|nr:hypothetical protein C8J57DRAFT_1243490 [Mycena rebaudengoi]